MDKENSHEDQRRPKRTSDTFKHVCSRGLYGRDAQLDRKNGFPSLERRGGRAIKKKNPFRYGTAGVVAHKSRFRMRFEAWCVSDHPVCASTVASQHFLYGAATPPQILPFTTALHRGSRAGF